jgi:hypothetical protein
VLPSIRGNTTTHADVVHINYFGNLSDGKESGLVNLPNEGGKRELIFATQNFK